MIDCAKSQEEADMKAVRMGMDRLFEGDPAPTQPFEELVSMQSENAIGEGGASRLVPWLRKNAARRSDYAIILTDPRPKSPELRSTMKSLSADLNQDLLNRLIVVTADSPAENRRWAKKNNADGVDIYSDEKREWMRAYTALGSDRWSMTLYVIADERIQKVAREVDGVSASRVLKNVIKSL